MFKVSITLLSLFISFSVAQGATGDEEIFTKPDGFAFSSETTMSLIFETEKVSPDAVFEVGATRTLTLKSGNFNIGWPTRYYLGWGESGEQLSGLHPDLNKQVQRGFKSGGGILPLEELPEDIKLEVTYLPGVNPPASMGFGPSPGMSVQFQFTQPEFIPEGIPFMGQSKVNVRVPFAIESNDVRASSAESQSFQKLLAMMLPRLAKAIQGALNHNKAELLKSGTQRQFFEDFAMGVPEMTTMMCETHGSGQPEVRCSLKAFIEGISILQPSREH
ncbi:MAG: hypothetical protein AAF203_01655 [Pseudomonadota bacterium]